MDETQKLLELQLSVQTYRDFFDIYELDHINDIGKTKAAIDLLSSAIFLNQRTNSTNLKEIEKKIGLKSPKLVQGLLSLLPANKKKNVAQNTRNRKAEQNKLKQSLQSYLKQIATSVNLQK